MSIHWKKNLIKVPNYIFEQVHRLGSSNIVAACIVKIKPEKILDGDFLHLDIEIVDGTLQYPERILPKLDVGRYSKYNILGREKIHKELPMVSKGYDVTSPNFGDWSKGFHDVTFYRDVYQREFFGPKYLEIKIELVGIDNKNNHIFKFSIDDVLNSKTATFDNDLLFDLNLLQENTGNHGVFSTDADLNEYLKSLYVNWEILPPGEIEEKVTRILDGIKSTDPKIRRKLVERVKVLDSLRPRNYVQGTSRFQRYFGAQFADDLVVFENIEYGNAIYIMFKNWEELSKISRVELMSLPSDEFIRIPHTKTWKVRLKSVIREEINKRQLKTKV